MRASAFFFCAAPLGYLFISNPWWLIPLRFFHGFATAILGPAAAAAISRIYFTNKGEKLGLYSSMTLIGRTIAPTIGGFAIAMAASQGLAPLLTYKTVYLIAFCASLPILFFIPALDCSDVKSNNKNNTKLKINDFGAGLKYFLAIKFFFHGISGNDNLFCLRHSRNILTGLYAKEWICGGDDWFNFFLAGNCFSAF